MTCSESEVLVQRDSSECEFGSYDLCFGCEHVPTTRPFGSVPASSNERKGRVLASKTAALMRECFSRLPFRNEPHELNYASLFWLSDARQTDGMRCRAYVSLIVGALVTTE